MASELKNLSIVSSVSLIKPSRLKIGVVYSSWNKEITHALKDGAVSQLLENNIEKQNILEVEVPNFVAAELWRLPCIIEYPLDRKDDSLISFS